MREDPAAGANEPPVEPFQAGPGRFLLFLWFFSVVIFTRSNSLCYPLPLFMAVSNDTKYVAFEWLLHAAFVADEYLEFYACTRW